MPALFHVLVALAMSASSSASDDGRPGVGWRTSPDTDAGTRDSIAQTVRAQTLNSVTTPIALTSPCKADFNGDTLLTNADVFAFLDAFAGGLKAADFNSDEYITFEDFDAFVQAFEIGCDPFQPILFPGPTFATSWRPQSSVIGDFDGDGYPDLAVANAGDYLTETGTVSVLRNLGNGTFAPKIDYLSGMHSASITIGDFDGDNKPDLAVANFGVSPEYLSTVSVLRNRGDGTFASMVEFNTGTQCRSLTAADFDGDGRLDLAVTSHGTAPSFVHGVRILRNVANDTFVPWSECATGRVPTSVAAGDLDGDGRPDLVVASGSDASVWLLRNRGGGVFDVGARVQFSSFVDSVMIADVDNDLRLDVVVAQSTLGPSPSTVRILTNRGRFGFNSSSDYAVGSGQHSVAACDLDNDARQEIIVSNYASNSVSILRNLGHGQFAQAIDFAAGESPTSVSVGNFLGDAKPDIVVSKSDANCVSILQNSSPAPGDVRLRSRTTAPTGGRPVYVAVGDVDNDGRPDLAVANSASNSISVLRSFSKGSFGSRSDYSVGISPQCVLLADIDGDRILDLTVASRGSNILSTLRGIGNGTFASRMDYPTGPSPSSAASGDVDGDGRFDVVVATWGDATRSGGVSVYRNTGSGTFDHVENYDIGDGTNNVTLGDVDGDGRLDIVATSWSGKTVQVLHNAGDGTFTSYSSTSTTWEPASVTLGDIDGDGTLDLIVANAYANSLSVFRNLGRGLFARPFVYPTGEYAGQAVVADFDGDRDNDIAVASHFSQTVSVLLNRGNGTFKPRTDYVTGRSPFSIAVGDFDGNGCPDVVTSDFYSDSASILYNEMPTASPSQSILVRKANYEIVSDVDSARLR